MLPSLPSGYDVTKHVGADRADCHLTVGFDQEDTHIPRFLVLLHYQVDTDPLQWDAIARMDHNETAALGHDVYQEGVHVDIGQRDGSTVHIEISTEPLPTNRGVLIRHCVDYLKDHAVYFIDVFEGDRSAASPPKWSDGGESAHTLITSKPVNTDMSREQPSEKILSDEELTDVLADATGTTPEEIRQEAEAMDWPAPEEATVVDK